MGSEELVLTLEEGVRIIRINRPKTKNAFTTYVYDAITNTLNTDAEDDKVVVTIITGTGDFYSSGFDIKSAVDEMNSGGDGSARMDRLRNMIRAFFTYPKLLIALVNGPAIGIAVTTAALCDIIYASDRATFETPFLRIGLCAEGCSSYTFPSIFGRSKASEMLFLGKKLTAHEAYHFGLVAEVIPHGKMKDFAHELNKLGKLSVEAVKRNKQLVLANYKDILCECCDRELQALNECFFSEDFSNAIMAFMSKKSKL